MGQGYQLIVIENEKVPLAAAPSVTDSNLWFTLAVMFVVAVLLSLWFYLMRCRSYKKRIRELNPSGGEYRGWNVRRLEQMVEELELELAAVNF